MLDSIVVGVTGLVGPDRFLKFDDLDRGSAPLGCSASGRSSTGALHVACIVAEESAN